MLRGNPMSLDAAPPARPRADPCRVLIVDDSVVVRGLVSRWIEAAPGLVVAGTAGDGQAALDLLETADPDIVLLDLDMPGLDGLAVLPRLLGARPDLPVVVVSTLSQRNAEISLRCLAQGAVDYLPKPSSLRELSLSRGFRDELVGRVEALAARRTPLHPGRRGPTSAPVASPRLASRSGPAVQAILIGASTGGPRAVIDTLSRLAEVRERVPVLVVQHMPPIFTRVFAEQIRTETGWPAREGRHGEPVLPGTVYVAPGGRHMGLSGGTGLVAIRIDAGPPVHHCRPALDVLFGEAAAAYGAAALTVVLTGMGQDGLDGARTLAKAGAPVLVQDEATSTVWGMPGSIARAGIADAVLPLGQIPEAVVSLVLRGGKRSRAAGAAGAAA